jgi:hypothetical protein
MTEEPEQQADRNVEDLEERGERVEDFIEETKRDWESKQASESVPGAVDPDEE